MMGYHYTEAGLDHIYLKNGYVIKKTPYGETIAFCALDTLHRRLAAILCVMPNRLQGQHVRFLRDRLDLSQKELADALGVQRITVARWEGAPNNSIPGAADRALRVLALNDLAPDCRVSDLVSIFRDIGEVGAPSIVMEYQAPVRGDDLFKGQDAEPETEENWHKAAA